MTGTNYDVAPGATRVELGNVIAPTTVASPTSLSFVVPLGATSAMRVVTPLGISAASTQLFVPPAGACTDYEPTVRPVLDGAASTISIATAGKKAVMLLSGTVGQALSLQFSSIAPSVAGTQLYYTIYNTANTSVGSGILNSPAGSIHLPVLPVTGTYSVVLYWSSATVTGTASVLFRSNSVLATNGTALNSSVPVSGQSTRLTFTGTAGRDLTLSLSSVAMPGLTYLNYQINRPGGTSLSTGYCYAAGNGCALVAYALPTTGTYEIVFTPYPGATIGSFNVQAWESSRVTGTLTVGTANTYTSTVAGQVVQKTFAGTAGEQRGLSLSGFSSSVSGATLNVIVLKPDGSPFTNNNFTATQTSPTAFVVDLPVLPTTGNYTVQVLPYQWSSNTHLTTTFSGSVLVTADVSGTLATNGTATAVSLTQAGQVARLTFTGTAGRDLTLSLSSVAMPGLTVPELSDQSPGRHQPEHWLLLCGGQWLRAGGVCVARHGHLRDCVYTVSGRHHRQLQCAGVGFESGHRHLNGGHRQHLHQHGRRAGGAEDVCRHGR